MGNSNSQLKRSRSQYGSTRNVAFSLPSTWDRRSYAYGEPINRTPSIASSTARAPPKPILRNSSSASSNGTFSNYRNNAQTRNMSRSMQSLRDPSLYEQERQFHRPSSVGGIVDPSQLTQRQYSDIYLKNDLRRHFRAQDKSAIVAQLDEGDRYDDIFDSTASLDRRLNALKSQRSRPSGDREQPTQDENKREGATERRISSKKKKAPLPNPVLLPINGNRNGMFKKKGRAPPPPVKEKCRSLSSLTSIAQVGSPKPDHRGSVTSLFDEIESELLTRHNIPISPTKEPQIEIPTPDYNSQLQQITPRGVKVLPSKKPKPKAPTTPVKVVALGQAPSFPKAAPLPIATQTPSQINTSAYNNTEVIVADVEIHTEPTTDSEDKPHVIPIKKLPVEVKKKESREIATQYNAPVEIAIQCSGHTLKQKPKSDTIRSNASSLSELVQLLSSAVQVVGESKTTNLQNISISTAATQSELDVTDSSINDTQSSCSDESSARLRNADSQKIVPMHEVLAGVPEPPPLPTELSVKLLQRRTITENTPISLAPLTSDHSASEGESLDISAAESPPRDFSIFQKELMKAYERIDEKRRSNPTPTRAGNHGIKRQDSNSSEASALKVFRHASTIMGINTPPPAQPEESDSGHDEPSDYNNSTVERTPSIPDFVFDGIVRSLNPSESEWSFDSASKSSLRNDKSKFNSIKRLKKSMRNFVTSISRNSGHKDITLPPSADEEFEEPEIQYSDANWTLSGRTKSPRPSITQPDTFSPSNQKRSTVSVVDSPTRSVGSPDSNKSSPGPQFKQTNMKSFALLTPMGYPGPSTTKQPSTTRPVLGIFRDETLADVPL